MIEKKLDAGHVYNERRARLRARRKRVMLECARWRTTGAMAEGRATYLQLVRVKTAYDNAMVSANAAHLKLLHVRAKHHNAMVEIGRTVTAMKNISSTDAVWTAEVKECQGEWEALWMKGSLL